MFKEISRTKEIESRLEKEGNTTYLDQKEHLEAISSMNDAMKEVRMDYKIKTKNSHISASAIVLNA